MAMDNLREVFVTEHFGGICTGRRKHMDRRQQKTRAAIFQAFGSLLAEQSYSHITVQEIIDRANVGTHYILRHIFETKDELLKALCENLFGHIIFQRKRLYPHPHGLYSDGSAPESIFCHLLQHLQGK